VHFLISSVIERIIALNSLLFLPEIFLNYESGQMFPPREALLRFALESSWLLLEESTGMEQETTRLIEWSLS
jgi:hypothetical protein